jgi:hypothetical protein
VFLSHSSADKATAQAVLEGLEGRGIRCWIAPRDIAAGSEYGQEIVEYALASTHWLDATSTRCAAIPGTRRCLN